MIDYKNCLDYVCRFTKTKIRNGKSLIELTAYEGTTLWFFVDFRFHNFVCRTLNSDINKKSTRNRILVLLYGYIKIYLNTSLLLLTKCLLKHYKQLEIKRDDENKTPKILFTAQDVEWRVIRDYETYNTKKSDAFFDSIITRLVGTNGFNLVGIFPLNPSVISLRVFIDKLKNWYIPHKPLNLYWSLDLWKKENEAAKYLKGTWSTLKTGDVFKNLCTYNGADLYSQMENEIDFYFYVLFPHAVTYIEMAKRMIEIEKPDLILIQNEYGYFERALVIAGKLKGIPTLAVQHGIITPMHHGYMFNKDIRGTIILPDITCVYGRYYYDLLTKNSIYDPEQVVVTGQPRYDILYDVANVYSKNRFLKTYGIDVKSKIVLWTTQSHGISDEENRKYLKLIFEVMQNIRHITLIIKQHPGEGEKYTRMIRDYMGQYDVDSVITQKNSDTYEQLYVCDLMITKNSTTAIEAVALNKPVIVLNLSGEPDIVNYVEEGIALGVYRENDLKTAIETLLKDDSELAKNRSVYVEKYLYRIDGKATERVANEINKLLRKNKHMQIDEN